MPRAGACLSASKSWEERKTWGQQGELWETSWPEIQLVNTSPAHTNNIIRDLKILGNLASFIYVDVDTKTQNSLNTATELGPGAMKAFGSFVNCLFSHFHGSFMLSDLLTNGELQEINCNLKSSFTWNANIGP